MIIIFATWVFSPKNFSFRLKNLKQVQNSKIQNSYFPASPNLEKKTRAISCL